MWIPDLQIGRAMAFQAMESYYGLPACGLFHAHLGHGILINAELPRCKAVAGSTNRLCATCVNIPVRTYRAHWIEEGKNYWGARLTQGSARGSPSASPLKLHPGL